MNKCLSRHAEVMDSSTSEDKRQSAMEGKLKGKQGSLDTSKLDDDGGCDEDLSPHAYVQGWLERMPSDSASLRELLQEAEEAAISEGRRGRSVSFDVASAAGEQGDEEEEQREFREKQTPSAENQARQRSEATGLGRRRVLSMPASHDNRYRRKSTAAVHERNPDERSSGTNIRSQSTRGIFGLTPRLLVKNYSVFVANKQHGRRSALASIGDNARECIPSRTTFSQQNVSVNRLSCAQPQTGTHGKPRHSIRYLDIVVSKLTDTRLDEAREPSASTSRQLQRRRTASMRSTSRVNWMERSQLTSAGSSHGCITKLSERLQRLLPLNCSRKEVTLRRKKVGVNPSDRNTTGPLLRLTENTEVPTSRSCTAALQARPETPRDHIEGRSAPSRCTITSDNAFDSVLSNWCLTAPQGNTPIQQLWKRYASKGSSASTSQVHVAQEESNSRTRTKTLRFSGAPCPRQRGPRTKKLQLQNVSASASLGASLTSIPTSASDLRRQLEHARSEDAWQFRTESPLSFSRNSSRQETRKGLLSSSTHSDLNSLQVFGFSPSASSVNLPAGSERSARSGGPQRDVRLGKEFDPLLIETTAKGNEARCPVRNSSGMLEVISIEQRRGESVRDVLLGRGARIYGVKTKKNKRARAVKGGTGKPEVEPETQCSSPGGVERASPWETKDEVQGSSPRTVEAVSPLSLQHDDERWLNSSTEGDGVDVSTIAPQRDVSFIPPPTRAQSVQTNDEVTVSLETSRRNNNLQKLRPNSTARDDFKLRSILSVNDDARERELCKPFRPEVKMAARRRRRVGKTQTDVTSQKAIKTQKDAKTQKDIRSPYVALSNRGCWQLFSAWCLAKGYDPLQTPSIVVSEFLSHLIRVERRSKPSLNRVVDNLSNVLKSASGVDITKNVAVKNALSEPSTCCVKRVSEAHCNTQEMWNLNVVLEAFKKPPFEPTDDVSIKHLTYKTALLTALASGRHCCDVHAIDVNTSQHHRDWKWIRCRTLYPHFSNTQADPWTVTSFSLIAIPNRLESPEDQYLCPVRAIGIYYDRTKAFRRERAQLFLPLVENEMTREMFTSWLKMAIVTAYRASSLHRMTSSARTEPFHFEASWKATDSPEDVLRTCFWDADNVFTKSYLKNGATRWSDCFTLSPGFLSPCATDA